MSGAMKSAVEIDKDNRSVYYKNDSDRFQQGNKN